MDHEMAEQQKTATKYLLNELTDGERSDFEDHFFECEICANLVKQDFTVGENLKQVLRERGPQEPVLPGKPQISGWKQWLQPASLIPTFAACALALVVFFQNAEAARIELLPDANPIAPVARGGSGAVVVKVDRAQPQFLLNFSVDGLAKPDSLVCEFLRASGSLVAKFTTPPKRTDLEFLVPQKLFPAGRYSMVMHPSSEPAVAVAYPFAIADSK